MGVEAWYRGVGIGVKPSKPDTGMMHLGDGLYLIDRLDIARIYATKRDKTAPDGGNGWQIWFVELERSSLGRVLDLTIDARWHQFMNAKQFPSNKVESRLHYVKQQSELYFTYFTAFLKEHKIDIKSYDAVIGPDYVFGGKQLCILHKNSQPTKLQERIRALLRLVIASTPLGRVTAGQIAGAVQRTAGQTVGRVQIPKLGTTSRFRAGLRFAVHAAGSVGVAGLLIYVDYRIKKHFAAEQLESALTRLRPKIDEQLARHTQLALAYASVGRQLNANVEAEVYWYLSMEDDEGWVPSNIEANLTGVEVSESAVKNTGDVDTEASFGQRRQSYSLAFSVPLSLPREQVDLFKLTLAELQWYDELLMNPILHQSDVERLTREQKELKTWMLETFGPPPEGKYGYDVSNWIAPVTAARAPVSGRR